MNPEVPTISPEVRLQIWREAVAHLRYLNDEVWKRFQFFLAVDLAMILGLLLLLRTPSRVIAFEAIALALGGILLTLTARYILKRNRIYYLQMLLKKTLLEKEAGFYELKFAQTETDMAFPWRLTPEVVGTLQNTPEEWIEQSIKSPKTIALRLFQIYDVVLVLFGALFLLGVFLTLKL